LTILEELKHRLSRLADFVMAALLAVIFITFLLQIFARYAPNLAFLVPIDGLAAWLSAIEPIGWTVNLISLLWVWLIFVGCAFGISEREHVVFDVFLQAMPPRLNLMLSLVVAAILVFCHGLRFPAHMGCRFWQPPDGIKKNSNTSGSFDWR